LDGVVSPHHVGDAGASVFGGRADRNGYRGGAPKRGAGADDDQFGPLQSAPRAPVRLSGAEIRRLFWQLVAVGERSATSIRRWSQWRRWHQAWARYYHSRRRKGQAPPAHQPGEAAQPLAPIDAVWHRLEPLLPPTQRTGRPFAHDRRLVLEAIVYVRQSDCAWRTLPSRFPPWQTVYAQLCRWRETGIWAKIWAGLEQPHPSG
jgi:hypothetical protein